jgi:hypothetical protein
MLAAAEIKIVPFKPKKTPLAAYIVVTVLLFAVGFAIYYSTSKDDERRARMRKAIKEKRAVVDAIKAVKKMKNQKSGDSSQESEENNKEAGEETADTENG